LKSFGVKRLPTGDFCLGTVLVISRLFIFTSVPWLTYAPPMARILHLSAFGISRANHKFHRQFPFPFLFSIISRTDINTKFSQSHARAHHPLGVAAVYLHSSVNFNKATGWTALTLPILQRGISRDIRSRPTARYQEDKGSASPLRALLRGSRD
jgi:hypothetical protein